MDYKSTYFIANFGLIFIYPLSRILGKKIYFTNVLEKDEYGYTKEISFFITLIIIGFFKFIKSYSI